MSSDKMRVYRKVFKKETAGINRNQFDFFTVYSDQEIKPESDWRETIDSLCPTPDDDNDRLFICAEPLTVSNAYLVLMGKIKEAENTLKRLNEEREILTGLLYYSIKNDDEKAVIGELLVYFSNEGVKVEKIQFIPQMPF